MAVVMGLVTTLLFYQYTKKMNSVQHVTVKTVKVVVAKEKIAKNETIAANKLEIVQMPQKAVLPQTIKTMGDAEGQIAATVIEKGEPILSNHIISGTEEDVYVSRKVNKGYRAVSVGVNFNQSVSNLIEPEDLVDVVFTKTDANNQIPPVSTILLQKARVLAVGRQMVSPDQSKEKYVEYSSVTLECKPQDAVSLINAEQQGKITLILNKRPAMDKNNNQK
jgi:pilus assembly protein CpaB